MTKHLAWLFAGYLFVASAGLAMAEDDGFKPIFDGKTLNGWSGIDKFWSVEDGAITGTTTPDNPTKGNTFLIWDQGKVDNFELKLKYRIMGGNSGIQYRSTDLGNHVAKGYQADIDSGDTYSGINYEERGRGILAQRGEKATVTDGKGPYKAERFAQSADLQAKINKDDWNEYHIIAKGNHLIHKINGNVTSEVIDEGEKDSRTSGILALQLHAGPPMKVQFKDIQLKRLPMEDGKKKVVFVPGTPSHAWGDHEHVAGCRLLMLALTENMPQFEASIYKGGWPDDPTAFDNADAVVVYCDGGERHLLNAHLDEFQKLMDNGVGLACIHYGVETPKGKPGDKFVDWIGGYFETHWSVNPHWTASFTQIPQHPVTNGVLPFDINDEWYYNMRFREDMEGVTPILTAIPPESTLSRPDGPHSGNPHVRAMKGQPQHVAWASEREDGGRGFGFTGGHYHWNWADPNFRKVVLNAIVWISHEEVPAKGVESDSLTRDDMEGLIPEPKPQPKKKPEPKKVSSNVKPLFRSPVITSATPNHQVDIRVDLQGAKKLYLVVTDGGNGFSCDWADWINPKLEGSKGELSLTDLKWNKASTDWQGVKKNRNVNGQPLMVNNKQYENGFGTHANSVIEFDIPEGYSKFSAIGGLDNGGTNQNGGSDTSVQFAVYTQDPGNVSQSASDASRSPESAVGNLDVYPGLQATLVAAEPELKSLTNIDIDHRGRIWVCDVMNYRGNNGSRKEGDRILILEDEDGDGVAEKSKVFYQGRDIDSAMGVCVLGNKVIVSAAPNVIVFTDENGDDTPDKKEMLFTKTGQPQHDHSAHSFLFGPDGKLYWNVGNTGQHVHDANGEVVVDLAGNKVVDNGQPYFGGMPFRCNLDGSDFEVLGHNFRNNYEVTVDSFGTLWQSDNDDDGNRGVRINYVMQYGNFGYRDQMTGAGWRDPRTNMEEEIPLRHWHLNDPGVVPNLLQTGAGSPTGICVYEGTLLPKVFQNQVIHCDAGPSIVRAYPVQNDGAGYSAESVDILKGARDNWFRPADVCVAPDGSIFVSDWYDPGVGGHGQRDLDRGRLFRVAPEGSKYNVPKFDFTTTKGCIEALKNPCLSVRYMAWTNLHNQGAAADAALQAAYKASDDPRYQARLLWLLGLIPGKGQQIVDQALSADDADLRIVGLRLAHELKLPATEVVAKVLRDPSPQVRRSAAIELRFDGSDLASQQWAELAQQHDGKDRWYLEALGIGADLHWDSRLAAYLSKVNGDLSSPATKDIVWRSRAAQTPELLAKLIEDTSNPVDGLARYFRAFDFQPNKDGVDSAVAQLAFANTRHDAAETMIIAESVKRLRKLDRGNAQTVASMEKALQKLAGTPMYIELVDRFQLENHYADLLQAALVEPQSDTGVAAVGVLLRRGQNQLLASVLKEGKPEEKLALTTAISNSSTGQANAWLNRMLNDASQDLQVRRAAVKGLANNQKSARQLLEMAKAGKLDEELMQAAASPLKVAVWEDVRRQANEVFPQPPSKGNQQLPPMEALVRMHGSVENGKKIFTTVGTCNKCHIVQKEGKEVGPNLSEIGSKLSREAMYEAILYPSASISHNYENWAVLTDSGTAVTGLKTSETDEAITITNAEGLARTIPKNEVEEIRKLSLSVMPNDLQKLMTVEELVDVVEYLSTLKK
ncbi:PVC-type heme-binding CxxCH protein [Bremerella cremea]|uniref:PVC-type heme-binding CxxCH protein n=1 Tax=Bremerella cremea TaxID=1031537 RepID=UPI0031E6E785